MKIMMPRWSRDWELYDDSHLAGNIIAGLTDDEVVEYLRWMACNRPQRYASIMTAFMEKQGMLAKAAVI